MKVSFSLHILHTYTEPKWQKLSPVEYMIMILQSGNYLDRTVSMVYGDLYHPSEDWFTCFPFFDKRFFKK